MTIPNQHTWRDAFAVPSKPTANALAEHAEAIKAAGTRVISDVVEIGRHLTEAKELCAHGQWLPWLDKEFGWTEQTALNFMRVHELAKTKRILDLNLSLSSLYLLARPSTPREAVEEVVERAESGERVSVAQVRDTIAIHKAPAKRRMPSYIPEPGPGTLEPVWDDMIDQIIELFRQLPPNERVRCATKQRKIMRGEA